MFFFITLYYDNLFQKLGCTFSLFMPIWSLFMLIWSQSWNVNAREAAESVNESVIRVNGRSQMKSSAFENVYFFERLSDAVCDAARSLSPLSTGVLIGARDAAPPVSPLLITVLIGDSRCALIYTQTQHLLPDWIDCGEEYSYLYIITRWGLPIITDTAYPKPKW